MIIVRVRVRVRIRLGLGLVLRLGLGLGLGLRIGIGLGLGATLRTHSTHHVPAQAVYFTIISQPKPFILRFCYFTNIPRIFHGYFTRVSDAI